MTDKSKLFDEVRKRFARCERYEATFRSNFREDVRFANGDARNHDQWPEESRSIREIDAKPCFTFNIVHQHNLQIINDARQNKMAMVAKATGGGASYESAQIYSGLLRHIEYQSNAQNVYTTAVRTQVEGGVGYWRVVADYADEDSFDQDIFIRRVKNPLSVYLDPDCNEADRSDARFGFIFDTLPKDEAEKLYPELKDSAPRNTGVGDDDDMSGWLDEDSVRICEYFRRSEKPDELFALDMDDGNGGAQRVVKRLSEFVKDEAANNMKPAFIRQKLVEAGAKFRKITDHSVTWYKIAGDQIVDERPWPGKYIPIVMLIGAEIVIDGQMDRKGHTRTMIDAQMNYNFWASEAPAQVALQSKIPWIADVRAIEGYESFWKDANRTNLSYLPYNGIDDDGKEIDKPERMSPPVMAQAYVQGLQIAQDQLRATSGQFQSEMGAPSNEKSGVAIEKRQRQADNATYHYVDHLGNAIRYTGRIVMDLIPKVYDTQRVIKILAEDGTASEITLDPNAEKAYLEHAKDEADNVRAIFNPNVGKYSVDADVGPSWATQREEAFNAISQMIQQNQQLATIVGDLLFKAADFPLADEIAERLHRMVPAQALGDAPPVEVQQLQQQNQALHQMIAQLTEKLAEAKKAQDSKDDRTMIDGYRAETDRIDVLKDWMINDQTGLMALVRGTVREAVGLDPNQAIEALTAPPPMDQPQPSQPQPPSGGFSMPEGQAQ